MIIAVVCDVLGCENNGTTIAAMNLIRSLRSKGHTVRIVCPDEEKKGQKDVYVAEKLDLGLLNGYVKKNGVNSDFAPRAVSRTDADRDKYIILFTGRYSKEKSHKILIDAAALCSHADKIQLVFAGDGPLKDKLRKQSEKLKNPPVFRFFSRSGMIDTINKSDLYVHPAEIEIEAIACLVAISCGLVPVISDSPRSATKYFVLDEKNLFRCNDSADLAAKIDYWLDHPEEKEARRQEYLGYTRQFTTTFAWTGWSR